MFLFPLLLAIGGFITIPFAITVCCPVKESRCI
jgi:hypothetical protein